MAVITQRMIYMYALECISGTQIMSLVILISLFTIYFFVALAEFAKLVCVRKSRWFSKESNYYGWRMHCSYTSYFLGYLDIRIILLVGLNICAVKQTLRLLDTNASIGCIIMNMFCYIWSGERAVYLSRRNHILYYKCNIPSINEDQLLGKLIVITRDYWTVIII